MKNYTPKTDTSIQNKMVAFSNALTRSAQGLNLVEKRVLFMALAKLDGNSAPVKIAAYEYADTFGLDVAVAYKELKHAAIAFLTRSFTLYDRTPKGNIGVTKYAWLGYVRYIKNEAHISIRFSEYSFPYLFELQGQFTQYRLKQASSLRSIYSWRLMELLEQMKDKKDNSGWLSITIEEFHHAMEATPTHKKNFKELRIHVIESSIKELREKDNWIIEWEAIKKGRKIASLRFNFQRIKKDDTDSPKPESEPEQQIEKIRKPIFPRLKEETDF